MSNHMETGRPEERVDVLIITAVKDEYDAVLKVDAGAWPGSHWAERPGPTGLDVAFRHFRTVGGKSIHVAVTRALAMGGVAATNAAAPLVEVYKPRCLAMCGVCAGRRSAVNLGDVIIADRLWTYDTGQLVIETDDSGQRVERVKGDILTYELKPPRWMQRADSFHPPADSPWLAERPRTYEEQMDWALERIVKGEDPTLHPDRDRECVDWNEKILELLWQTGRLHDGTLNLTNEGRTHINRVLMRNPNGLSAPKPFKVHVGPIGTGNKVIRDPQIFDKLSSTMRTVKGLEMEAAAIGAIASLREIPHMIVMKGVMDFADSSKDDHFKPFAARSSAECLLAFLRENLPPAQAEPIGIPRLAIGVLGILLLLIGWLFSELLSCPARWLMAFNWTAKGFGIGAMCLSFGGERTLTLRQLRLSALLAITVLILGSFWQGQKELSDMMCHYAGSVFENKSPARGAELIFVGAPKCLAVADEHGGFIFKTPQDPSGAACSKNSLENLRSKRAKVIYNDCVDEVTLFEPPARTRIDITQIKGEKCTTFGQAAAASREPDFGEVEDAGTPEPTREDAGSPEPTREDAGSPEPTREDAGSPEPTREVPSGLAPAAGYACGFVCGDGSCVRPSKVCDGIADCSDGGDESVTHCKDNRVMCCLRTGGCPGESAYENSSQMKCACCPTGRVCCANPMDGCCAVTQ